MTEGIRPPAAGERVDPALLAHAEDGHLLVEAATARVRVAHEDRRAPPPAARAREHGVEERILSAAHAVRHVEGAEHERQRRGDLDHEPACAVDWRRAEANADERPARRD